MKAHDVYNVAKALTEEEFYKLFYMVQEDINMSKRSKKKPIITEEQALNYLIKNVFSKIK
ncbi:hypothetical protein [Maribacter sp. R77961]|uniref:hypothetical protein n=1 Tax=Maribacter sp. R77961 TaxID=3093871 RepID=UPI0037C5765D